MAAPAKLVRLTTVAFFSPTPSPAGPRPVTGKPRARTLPPIAMSMDPAVVDLVHLQALMLACSHSCALRLSPAPQPAEPVDIRKLHTALAHSFIVVSVFCSARFMDDAEDGSAKRFLGLGLDLGLGQRGEQRLVGFGRAVSDLGLTASVHDVVVHPSLQRRGIGRKILDKITRILHSRGIYDISALCTEKERTFFEACGFGNDMLGSTTMLYTKRLQK